MKNQKILRRDWLKTMGAAGIGAALGGCASVKSLESVPQSYSRPLSRRPFIAPRISHDRVVRVIAGHRPYRPSGFVVRREQMDDKTVIHNYGHGGGGLSLSWGSSALAVRKTHDLAKGQAAVIGCGAMGLSTARLLQDAGWAVTIYTRDATRHTTSNMAVGHWSPSSVFEEGVASAEFESELKWASRISHHAFQNLIGAGYGVSWMENYNLGDEPIGRPYYLRELPELYPLVADLEPHEHPFPVPYVQRVVTMLVEPAAYLRRIQTDFYQAGGRLIMQNFANRSEILALNEPVIFNCTGLGAARLFDDDELVPVKGQLVFILPDPDVDYLTTGGGAGMLHMVPRSGEIVLGGTHDHGDWTTQIDPDETDRIITENQKLFANFG
jgi:glycine/D-amino acid oxidase-like deaminating enzyme